jgi:trimethylamine--corrinoid protein Co-methyltransferase
MTHLTVNQTEFATAHFQRLSTDQCRRIHWASLEILERIGIRLYLQEAIDLLKKAGADIEDGNLALVPPGMVEKALSTAPKRVVLCDRHGEPVMPLEGSRCFYGPGSDCMHIVDHRTGVRRRPILDDVKEGTVLCDALTHVDFVMSMVVPSDVEDVLADRFQMKAMLSHTTKPIIVVTYDLDGLIDAIEMTERVVGGAATLRRKPLTACYINVATGLRHNKEALQKLLFLAEKRLPALYIPVSTCGVSAPVTAAGAIAIDYAGALLGLVLSQLKQEGSPFIAPGMQPSPLDLRTLTSPYCPAERGIAQAMGHFYNLPQFALGGASDSKVVDQQAAAEAALTLLTETLGGGNLVHDLGYLESGLTFSFTQLVICDEIVSWIKAFVQGIEISDQTLALDLIAQYRDQGPYLESEHTRRNFRRRWYPDLFERADYETWLERGGQDLGQRATARVKELLNQHQPEPLPQDVQQQLQDVMAGARSADG